MSSEDKDSLVVNSSPEDGADPAPPSDQNSAAVVEAEDPAHPVVVGKGSPSRKKGGGVCCGNCCCKILLLLWKNLLLRRCHFVTTILEVVIPLLFSLMMLQQQTYSKPGTSTKSGSEKTKGLKLDIMAGQEISPLKCQDSHWSGGPNNVTSCGMHYIPRDLDKDVKNGLVRNSDGGIAWNPGSSLQELRKHVERLTLKQLLTGGEPQGLVDFGNYAKSGTLIAYQIVFLLPDYQDLTDVQTTVDEAIISWIAPASDWKYTFHEMKPTQPSGNGPPGFNPDKVSTAKAFDAVIFLELGFLIMIISILQGVVIEKETGIKELMKLSGLPNWMHWAAWTVNYGLISTVTVSLITLCIMIYESKDDANEPKRVLWKADGFLVWISLWLYALASMAFCFFLSAFFYKPVIAYVVGSLVWMVSVLVPDLAFTDAWEDLTLPYKLGLCLIPNTGLVLAFSFFFKREQFGGMKWRDLFQDDGDDHLSLGLVWVMMIASAVIYFFLAVYFEAVLPSEFGIRRPLYFPFLPSFWGCRFGGRRTSKVGRSLEGDDRPGFEPEPQGLEVGVEIKDLRKVFGKHAAVDGVSLKMYQGEIFALLGHNGAGKTTLISCCIGMTAPSSGTALINGSDIVKEMDQVRQGIGICPQHNLLFDELTVDQHLVFFGKLKGGQSSVEAKKERMELLDRLELVPKQDTASKKLSGGQKRKLCLGIALIGNANVIFLDEPTSGMDVEARRAIWDLLMIERQRRAIVLTTHFMEEADVLGDRIGIMAHGKVQCCGTSSFLKKFYGAGYTLTMTVSELNQATKKGILSAVRSLVPTAFLAEETPNTPGDQIDVTLPTEDCATAIFSKLFKSLQDKRASFGIKTFGLSLTTMDEVFVKVDEAYSNSLKGGKLELVPIPFKASARMGSSPEDKEGPEESDPGDIHPPPKNSHSRKDPKHKNRKHKKRHNKHSQESTTSTVLSEADPEQREEPKPVPDVEKKGAKKKRRGHIRGVCLILLQFLAFLIKRFHYSRRKWKLFIAQILIPLFLVWLAIIWANAILPDLPVKPGGKGSRIGRQTYPTQLVTYYRDKSSKLTGNDMKGIIGPSAKLLDGHKDFADLLKDKYDKNPAEFYTKSKVAFEIKSSKEIHVYYQARDSMTLNMAANLKLRLASGKDIRIEMTQLPPIIPFNETNLVTPLQDSFLEVLSPIGILMPLALVMLGASFIVPPMEEKISSGKQLQLMTGASPAVYWGSAFFWDFILMILVSVGVAGIFFLTEKNTAFTIHLGWGVIFLLLITFAFAAIPFAFLASLAFSRISCGFAAVMGLHYFAGILGFYSGALLEPFKRVPVLFAMSIAFRVLCFPFPTYPLTMGMVKYVILALRKSRCNFLPSNREALLCQDKNDEAWGKLSEKHGGSVHVDQCCKHCKGTYKGEPCVEKLRYITWWTNGVPGLGMELLFLVILGVIYSVLLLLLEVWIGAACSNAMTQNLPPGEDHDQNEDQDVEEEAQRVFALANEKKVDEDALVLINFSRNYGTFAAVKDVNFGLHHGECFGLLGVNGAGKTTTFRMLTGDESRTSGNAYASRCNLKSSRRKFLSKIGYCPQFDGIIGVLTGLEMVSLFARLRGVKEVNKESKKWVERVGLTDSENVQCRKYSGGMKRRLSAAMALVGDPDILLLDEPTTGVDPVSRREFWKIILSTKAEGRAIILTSHSMDEIAACCTRLAIMVNGELQCLGGVQYLKNKFAQGFSLDLKLTSAPGTEGGPGEEEFASLDREILDKLAPCMLKDSHATAWQYHIQDASVPWDVLYSKMEDIKVTYSSLIQDYSFSETTLEQVFLAFARMQYPPRTAPPGGCCACGCLNKK